MILAFDRDKKARVAKQQAPQEIVIPAEFKRPKVMVVIPEMHIAGRRMIDPAAETEVTNILIQYQFPVIDSEQAGKILKESNAFAAGTANTGDAAALLLKKQPTLLKVAKENGVDILIYGEAISEFGAALGDFNGCRARVELKAVRTSDQRVLLSESEYAGSTDLAESIAGKQAIQNAAKKMTPKFALDLVKKWNQK